MSQDNVEVVRAGLAAWNAGDMDAWGGLLSPDVVWRPPPNWPEPEPHAGPEAVLRAVQQLREAWDADALEPIGGFIDAADQVIVRLVWRGRGHGPVSNMEVTCVYTVRGEKISAFEFFWNHADAVEAVGRTERNMEIVRQALAAFNRRDPAAWLELCDAALENSPPREWPESDPMQGPEVVWDFLIKASEPWEATSLEHDDLIDAGSERVVARVRGQMKGKASGASVPWSFWQVVTLRGGKVRRIEWFADRAEALRTVGLSE
jgi:ketosteroid isomerase-like protein